MTDTLNAVTADRDHLREQVDNLQKSLETKEAQRRAEAKRDSEDINEQLNRMNAELLRQSQEASTVRDDLEALQSDYDALTATSSREKEQSASAKDKYLEKIKAMKAELEAKAIDLNRAIADKVNADTLAATMQQEQEAAMGQIDELERQLLEASQSSTVATTALNDVAVLDSNPAQEADRLRNDESARHELLFRVVDLEDSLEKLKKERDEAVEKAAEAEHSLASILTSKGKLTSSLSLPSMIPTKSLATGFQTNHELEKRVQTKYREQLEAELSTKEAALQEYERERAQSAALISTLQKEIARKSSAFQADSGSSSDSESDRDCGKDKVNFIFHRPYHISLTQYLNSR
jgi:hypothetical protein